MQEQYSNSSTWVNTTILVAVSYLVLRYLQSFTFKLRHIPSVGSSGIISSYREATRFFREGRDVIQEGYAKYRGRPYKVAMMGRYMVVASGPEMLADIRRAPQDQLSFREAVAVILQNDYMLGPQTRLDPFHIPIVRTPLTRNLGYRFLDIKDEIEASFAELISPTKEWTDVHTLPILMRIVIRTTNRLYVGLPLCRNADYIQLFAKFTLDVFQGAQTINRFPRILRPIVGRYMTKVPANVKRVISHIGPLIEERLRKEKQDPEWVDDANDLITWLLDEAKGPQRTVEGLALRVLTINFASIHQTSMALTNALYDLAAYPEYAAPLREEIEAVVAAEGWSKSAMGRMRKLDSFLKESQRLAVNGLTMDRKVMKDFTFSNGVTVPAGAFIAMAAYPSHYDESLYPDAHSFKGFRFAEMRDEEGEGTKHQMVALSDDYMTFGTGRTACPGRFFAVNELKAIIAHILLTYDVRFPNNNPRPPNIWFQTSCSPNPAALVSFKKRA